MPFVFARSASMNDTNRELLAAERRGRELARRETAAGSTWILEAGDSADGRCLMAAARWAMRLGAEVRLRLTQSTPPSPLWQSLSESCRRQGIVDESQPGIGNSGYIVRGGDKKNIGSLPDDNDVWKASLAVSPRFVILAADSHEAVTCAQCREIDRVAIRDFAVPGVCLMENAAIAATAVAVNMLPPRPATVLVAVGGGNNGGDGLVMARGLALLGFDVEVALLKPRESISGDAGVNLDLLGDFPDVTVHAIHDAPAEIRRLLRGKSLVVDALLGTGFKGGLSPQFRDAILHINAAGILVLALDLPSGLNGDSGEVADVAIRAERTITFAAVKTGLRRGDGPSHCGKMLYLGDIGAPTAAYPV